MGELKAWIWGDHEEAGVVFAETEEEAAEEYGEVRREPRFDDYAPGPVPAKVLLDAGWWLPCDYCQHRVAEDGCDDCNEERDGELVEPVFDDESVYCSEECREARLEELAARKAREARIREHVARRFPGSYDVVVWSEPAAEFRVPGCVGRIQLEESFEHVLVEPGDLLAWRIYDSTASAIYCGRWRPDGGES